jgi:hypothetical protein
MLKEKGISLVSKLIVSEIISSINYNKRKEKNILSGIQENDFQEYLIRVTDYIIQ